jgi:hypothetical protein
VLRESCLQEKLSSIHEFDEYVLYGDPGYKTSGHIVAPIRNATPDSNEARMNAAMSSVRVSVEWAFGYVQSNWGHVSWVNGQRVLLSPVGLQYRVAVLLSNCLTCLRGGNIISDKFGVNPPTLEEYLQAS